MTQEELKELLFYDLESGIFTWISGRRRGQKAGCVQNDGTGYSSLYIKINRTSYKASHIAWLYVTGNWPLIQIDHRDGDSLNDSFENLREATHAQNTQNSKRPSHNTSGIKGIDYSYGKWRARIMKEGKRLDLGRFSTFTEAAMALREARKSLHGDFGRDQ